MRDRGSVPLALIILLIIGVLIIGGIAVSCDALFEDEEEVNDLGLRIELVSHDYDGGDCEWEGDCGGQSYDQWRNEDRNRNRDRNRGAFSPGPFDRSPIEMRDVCISLDCSGREKERRGDDPPPDEPMMTQSLFPPTFEGVKSFVLSTIEAGIGLGRLFANATIDFVSTILVGIA